MSDGRRWLALDADLFGKPFTDALLDEFGWAGVATWIAFLCACKRSRTPGQINVYGEAEALVQMGILGRQLATDDGRPWTLTDFWRFTGRKKQTKRMMRGRTLNVRATHWERWQEAARDAREAERKRTSRAGKRPHGPGQPPDSLRTNGGLDSDLDLDTPPTPPTGGLSGRFASNGNDPARPVIPDWQGDPVPDEPVVISEAVGQLRQVMKR